MIKALIINPDKPVRTYLNELIAIEKQFEAIDSLMHFWQTPPENISLDIILTEVFFDNTDPIFYITKIKKHFPDSILIVLTKQKIQKGSTTAIDLLTAGASSYFSLPEVIPAVDSDFSRILLIKIHSQLKKNNVKGYFSTFPNETAAHSNTIANSIHAIGIGASTGGPEAVLKLLKGINRLNIPIYIVQHMPPVFTGNFAQRLNRETGFNCYEATHKQKVQRGCVYLAPGDFHMSIQNSHSRTEILLNKEPPVNSCRPAVDVLFKSLTQFYHKHLLAIVLTGMGKDGLEGARQIRNNHGSVIVQDKMSSVVWGMPGLIANEQLANFVLPLDEIAPEVNRILERNHAK